MNEFEHIPTLYLGILGSLVAGLGTGVGALPILIVNQITPRIQGICLGFGAGVMLAATSFSLIVPSLEAAHLEHQNTVSAALIVVIGILLGGAFLWFSHQYFPHEHFIKGAEGENLRNLKRIWLFITAIAIHNFPEGLAVGVGFGSDPFTQGLTLTLGIGLQNMPEGFVVAIALLTAEKYSRLAAFSIALLTGLVEPIGGLIGVAVVSWAHTLLPWAMAFAAGTMLFVISDEIIPESHSLGQEKEATVGIMLGFVIMMFLDVTLG